MFERSRVFFFEITNVWEVWRVNFLRVILHLRIFTCNFFTWELWREIIWDRGCLLGVGFFFFLRSWMFVRCGVFFFGDRRCLTGVGYFFFEIVDVCEIIWDRGCLLGVGYFFFGDRRCLTGVGYFFRDRRCLWNYLRSWMFVRCGVFFFGDRRCLTGVEYFFWDHECLTGVGYFFFWDHECLLGVGYFLLRDVAWVVDIREGW